MLIFDDFNFPTIHLEDSVVTNSDALSNNFLKCTINNALYPLVYFPTRLNNKLDLILRRNVEFEPAISLYSPLL